jgi:colanic acid biosynthesis glycosyl transferase WcaI
MAYRSASRIVVISEACEANLRAKGVPPWKLKRIYNPSSRVGQTDFLSTANVQREQRLLCMGNIGHSQGLVQIVRAWEDSDAKTEAGTLVIVGAGVEAGEVADEIRSSTVQMLGLLTNEDLELELRRASLGVVTQRPDVAEFNLPSKLMNFMAYGLPVLAAVRPDSEVAGIIEGANAGWVVDSADPAALPRTGAEVLADVGELSRRGRNGEAFAARNFDPAGTAEQWDDVLDEAIGRTAAYASYALAR